MAEHTDFSRDDFAAVCACACLGLTGDEIAALQRTAAAWAITLRECARLRLIFNTPALEIAYMREAQLQQMPPRPLPLRHRQGDGDQPGPQTDRADILPQAGR
jgi:hypothetical protein